MKSLSGFSKSTIFHDEEKGMYVGVPLEENERYDWQLDHTPNQTGTINAYSPKSSSFNRKKSDKDLDYEKWKPGN